VEFDEQPCQCNCTFPNGKPGVLVNKIRAGYDKCTRLEAVQRRIDKGRIQCVDAAGADCAARAEAAGELHEQMQDELPFCPCTCQRSKNHWGVLIERKKDGELLCARNGRATRNVGKGKSSCVSTCPKVDSMAAGDSMFAAEADKNRADWTGAAADEPLPMKGFTGESGCQCPCQRENNANRYGVWIQMTRDGEIQCAREGRAGRTIAKSNASCYCPPGGRRRNVRRSLEVGGTVGEERAEG